LIRAHTHTTKSLSTLRSHLEQFLPHFNTSPQYHPFSAHPPSLLPLPSLILELALIPKKLYDAPDLSLKPSNYHQEICCYTDSSERKTKVGLAYSVYYNHIYALSHRNILSISTAEVEAILHYLQTITPFHFTWAPTPVDYLLFSDSLYTLQSIADPYTSHPITQRILLLRHTLS